MPQVVKLPPMPAADATPEDFFVAYSTVPQVLSPLARKLPGARVLLFVKEKRLAFYTRKYRKYPNIEVRQTSSDFADYVRRNGSQTNPMAVRLDAQLSSTDTGA